MHTRWEFGEITEKYLFFHEFVAKYAHFVSISPLFAPFLLKKCENKCHFTGYTHQKYAQKCVKCVFFRSKCSIFVQNVTKYAHFSPKCAHFSPKCAVFRGFRDVYTPWNALFSDRKMLFLSLKCPKSRDFGQISLKNSLNSPPPPPIGGIFFSRRLRICAISRTSLRLTHQIPAHRGYFFQKFRPYARIMRGCVMRAHPRLWVRTPKIRDFGLMGYARMFVCVYDVAWCGCVLDARPST